MKASQKAILPNQTPATPFSDVPNEDIEGSETGNAVAPYDLTGVGRTGRKSVDPIREVVSVVLGLEFQEVV
jgi:hypothetical protein